MKRNGFTLIELLAVIVVLAIIALIATPIVLNIINNAKTSSNERSGELYIKAVENAIMKKQMNGTETVEDGEYTVQSDGSICIVSNNTCTEGTTITIDVEGDIPTEGTITVSNGVVVNYNLVVSGTSVTKGENSDDSTDTICTLVSGTSKSEGAKYSCKVNDTDTFYFYVLGDEDDNYINLIMDRNICNDGTSTEEGKTCLVEWISIEDYLSVGGNSEDYGEEGNVNKGPITALNYLKIATSSWTNIDYDYGELVDEGNIYSNISLEGYHARLPQISDYYDGTESAAGEYFDSNSWNYYDGNNEYLFDNMELTCYDDNEYDVDCSIATIIHGVNSSNINHIDEIEGYWLSSSFSLEGYSPLEAWVIFSDGDLHSLPVSDEEESGIRPVITVKKSKLN